MRRLAASVLVIALAAVAAAAPVGAARSIDSACQNAPRSPYHDRGSGELARAIDCVALYGLTTGKTASTYGTRDLVQRGQMASLVVRLLRRVPALTLPQPGDRFPDDGGVHEDAIETAAALNPPIVSGQRDGRYHPEAPVTRGQMAAFVERTLRAAGMTLPTGAPGSFGDDDGHPHEGNIDTIADNRLDLIDGFADGTYRPDAAITRGEVAIIIARAVDALVDDGRIPAPENGEPLRLGSHLVDYVALPGDQVVVVPNGRYNAGEVQAPHVATSGPQKGWLVLVSETPGGAVVDLSSAPLTLRPGTSRIMFVGFKFVNGRINHDGASDISYWYTEHTYPIEVWAAEYRAANGDLPSMVHRVPHTVRVGGAKRISFYGSDFHDIGDDAISGYATESLHLEGVRIWNVEEKEYDPGFGGGNDKGDLIHNDAIGSTGGLDRLTIRDSYIAQRLYIGAENGSVGNITIADTWLTNSQSAGVIFNSREGNRITGTRTNVRSFDHRGRGNIDRLDIVNRQHHQPNARPALINVEEVGNTRRPPEPDAPDPALQWRAEHPYESWKDVVASGIGGAAA